MSEENPARRLSQIYDPLAKLGELTSRRRLPRGYFPGGTAMSPPLARRLRLCRICPRSTWASPVAARQRSIGKRAAWSCRWSCIGAGPRPPGPGICSEIR
nr:unnamed protein product [Callosobruchus analis]